MRIISFFAILFFLSGCFLRRESDGREEGYLLPHGLEEALDAGDTVKAIEVLTKYNATDSITAQSRAMLIYIKMKRRLISKGKALTQVKRIAKEEPRNMFVAGLYASMAYVEQTPEQRLVIIDKAIAQNPESHFSHHERGRILNQLGRYADAIVSFNAAIAIDPSNRYSYADRALSWYMNGAQDKACEDWRTPGGGATSYYDKYCKWPEIQKEWDKFIAQPNHETAENAYAQLPKRALANKEPVKEVAAHMIETWLPLSRSMNGNKDIFVLGLKLLAISDSLQQEAVNIELGKYITSDTKMFLIELNENRQVIESVEGLVCTYPSEIAGDKRLQLQETERRILAITPLSKPDIIKIRGQCLLQLERMREKLLK